MTGPGPGRGRGRGVAALLATSSTPPGTATSYFPVARHARRPPQGRCRADACALAVGVRACDARRSPLSCPAFVKVSRFLLPRSARSSLPGCLTGYLGVALGGPDRIPGRGTRGYALWRDRASCSLSVQPRWALRGCPEW